MSSTQRQYLVEGASHSQLDTLVTAVDGIDHRAAVIGRVRFYIWKHLWAEAGNYMCGLNDPDIRRVVAQLGLSFDNRREIANAQFAQAQRERLNSVLFGNEQFAGTRQAQGTRGGVATVNGPAPARRTLPPAKAQSLARRPLPDQIRVDPPLPAATKRRRFFGPVANEPAQPGLDLSLDTTMTFGISLVARHLDGTRFRGGPVIGDFMHEPTLTFSMTLDPRPDQFGTVAAAVSWTTLNLHFQEHDRDLVELGLAQLGFGLNSQGAVVTLGAQAEIHSHPHSGDDHFSITIGTGGTLQTTPGGPIILTWNPITFGLLWHAVNP